MKKVSNIVFILLACFVLFGCGTSGGEGPAGGCSADSDCSDYCSFTGEWRENASGSETNGGFCAGGECYCCYAQFLKDPVTQIETDGYCMACDEGGTDCDWDINYSCYSTEDVCLYDY